LPANSRASLATFAYREVRRRIVRGEMAIGQAVSRRKIAAELGMSFLPVSEALLRLEFEGMLESRPRAGTRVRIPTRKDVKGHYLLREILEAESARRFAAHATKSERAGLLKIAARLDALSTRPDRGPYLTLHHRLHSRIAECSRCDALSAVIEQTSALSSTWFCLLPGPEPPSTTRRHRDLAKALVTSAPDEAAVVMREHVRYSEREAIERLKPYFLMKRAHGRTFFRSERAQARQYNRSVPGRAQD